MAVLAGRVLRMQNNFPKAALEENLSSFPEHTQCSFRVFNYYNGIPQWVLSTITELVNYDILVIGQL